MDGEAALARVVSSIAGALRSRTMVPSAMFSAGVFEAVVALALLVANTPKALVVVYYVVLTAGAIVGSTTASASFYVARDLEGRHATGMTLLCASTLSLSSLSLAFSFFLLKK
ncbi:LOW QUALITY PROTEIN: hypothetical protein BDA96_09G233000 [Sorghum bicolor]|uniref:Uncharacterized protein n=1 Tax=Sorghum bicolor TaxID=4558 RepID=A0A921QBW0_SORBI|nr:LOW QUALITY PROTEIN: hypothetical protein BDA96_09G233000 [Sorghum bicolor]